MRQLEFRKLPSYSGFPVIPHVDSSNEGSWDPNSTSKWDSLLARVRQYAINHAHRVNVSSGMHIVKKSLSPASRTFQSPIWGPKPAAPSSPKLSIPLLKTVCQLLIHCSKTSKMVLEQNPLLQMFLGGI